MFQLCVCLSVQHFITEARRFESMINLITIRTTPYGALAGILVWAGTGVGFWTASFLTVIGEATGG